MPRATQFALVALLAACSPDQGPAAVQPDAAAQPAGDPYLTVHAQNVYVGTNVDAVLTAPADQLQARLFEALQTFAATDWTERAARIADRIVAAGPDLVSLNEVSRVTVQGLNPFFPDMTVDFLPVLLAALEARGGAYVVAGAVANIDAHLDIGGPSIRLEDFDVVLARRGIDIRNVQVRNYAARVSVPLGALGTIDLVRGMVVVDATSAGRTVRFVATHLEPQETSLALQLAQTAELLAVLSDAPYPVVIAGDLNSDPADASPVTSYRQLLAAGYRDTWLDRAGPRVEDGYTCCTSPELRDAVAGHHKRIDLVLARPAGHPRGRGVGPVRFDVFGDDLAERTASGMWPSDHAGITVAIPWRQLDGNTAR
jgi:endonuclease/exonuclease/phosphatase family metal-dependent hydrolase